MRGGAGEHQEAPGDLAFLPQPVGGALGELGHRGSDDLRVVNRVQERPGDQDLLLGRHLVLHRDGGEAIELQDGAHLHHGELVRDGHRVGITQLGDGLDPRPRLAATEL